MESFTSNSPSPITDDARKMVQRNVKEIDRTSSTPVTRLPRESLAGIKKNTVSGMVNRFTQLLEWTNNDVVDRKPAIGPVGRQVSFFTDFSTINEASENGIDSKLNSVDSGYDSFRRRSRSVNSSSMNNASQSQSLLAKFEKYPNFKFSYLKYFGVDPTEYLSTFGVDFNSVSNSTDSTCKNSSNRRANGGDSVVTNITLTMRKRSQTLHSKRTFDSTSIKVSNLKYVAVETSERDETKLKKSGPKKVATVVDCTDFEDVFSTKAATIRDAFLKKSLRSVATQTSKAKMESVDSDVVSLPGKISPDRRSKALKKTTVDNDLKSRIQGSIESYDSILKSLRDGGIRNKKRTASEAK
ncbi:uncharacterized protein LOC119085421 isoform X2 [Bradysia coprophila]|uniref:uncharacterized protein LOC119085421 isoform X2 n=1 Tax=Bradysia coprophila TaxID=38358 RepID=UPI00187DB388|nr:uncharacterized protein LOC119085421 isoform X2 [Bradysia coprophila]